MPILQFRGPSKMMDFNLGGFMRIIVIAVALITSSTGILPEPCPRILECPSCDDCSMVVNGTGDLTCVAGGEHVIWKVEESEGFNTSILAEPSGSSEGSVHMEYTPWRCDGRVSVLCVVNGKDQSKNGSSSRIILHSEPCVAVVPPAKSAALKVSLIVIVLLSAIAAIAGMLYYWKRSEKDDVIPYELELKVISPEQPAVSGTRLTRKELVKLLIKSYTERELPLADFLLECDCILSLDDDVSSCSSVDLLEHELWNIDGRIIFLAEVGYGKTTLVRHVIHRWITSQTNDLILIYLPLADLDKESSLIDEIRKLLPPKKREVTNLRELLENNPCILFLDGLNEFSMSQDLRSLGSVGELSQYDEIEERLLPASGLRIADFLDGKRRGCSELRVWVATRQKASLRGVFKEPFCTVHMKGVSKATRQTYLEGLPPNNVLPTVDADTSLSTSASRRKAQLLTQFLGLAATKEFTFFTKSPMLFSVFTDDENDNLLQNVTKINFTTLVQITLNCLEYRFQQKMKTVTCEDDVENTQRLLCKVALKQTMWKTPESRADGDISERDIEIGVLIGYLKLSIDSSGIPSSNTIRFTHDSIQEYFTAWSLDLMENVPSWLQAKLKTPETLDPKTKRLLKFLFGFGSVLVDRIAEDLVKNKQWDLLVDCLYEVPSSDRAGDLLARLQQKKVVFNLEDTEFHFDAITEFCEICKDKKIKLKAVHLIENGHSDRKEQLICRVQSLQRNVKLI